jgi:type 1 glutamine amidotransferase
MNTNPFTQTSRRVFNSVLSSLLLLGGTLNAADLPALSAETRQRIEQAIPLKATAQPAKPRRLLIFTRNREYQGHAPAIASSCEAFTLMGKKTGAFETTITDDPAVFAHDSLQKFDAVFLNNTLGVTFTNAQYRQNLLEFVTGGGGLMGVHSSVLAFTKSLWPAQEDWPEFGYLIGARGYAHRHGYTNEPITITVADLAHPVARAFGGQSFELSSEFFRHHEPWSRQRVRVLLSMDTAKTDLSTYQPGDACLRADNDYALAWVKHYGRGRVFYTCIGHGPELFENAQLLQFYLDAAQFVLGDLPAPTTPSAKLSPAVVAQEKLGWRLGIEAYTFHKYHVLRGHREDGGARAALHRRIELHAAGQQGHPEELRSESHGRRVAPDPAQAGRRGAAADLLRADHSQRRSRCRKLFEFGRKMGFETFMCEPKSRQLDLLDKLANEYGINVAIHNHGQNISPAQLASRAVLKALRRPQQTHRGRARPRLLAAPRGLIPSQRCAC